MVFLADWKQRFCCYLPKTYFCKVGVFNSLQVIISDQRRPAVLTVAARFPVGAHREPADRGRGPGPQPVHSIAAGPSVGKLSKYHQGRGTFTSTQSSALENRRQT